INYIITYGSYGDATKKNAGICGVGEMWGYYVGGLLATEQYGGDRFTGRDYWFRPFILRRLVDNTGLTQKQIFDCLTSDIRSHEQFKNRLISRYGNKREQIEEAFSVWGF
ncbi:hypothetical protein, partial [Alkalitalea saponilacus]